MRQIKRLLSLILIISMLTATLGAMTVFAETTSVSVPVTISGEYQGTNHWANATYTFDVIDGVANGFGWISNGEYKFMYYPNEGKIKNASQASSFALEEGKSIPEFIVIPYTIDGFRTDYANYEAKTIAVSAANTNYSIFRNNTSANTTIVIPEGVTEIPNNAFGQNSKDNKKQTFVLPSTLTSIGTNGFQQGSSGGLYLNFDIPSGVASIGSGAFQNCRFTDIVIPVGVKTINSNIFAFCYNLANVTFKGEISNLTGFRKCNGIKTITFEGKTAPTVDANAFYEATTITPTIYYPANGVGYTDDAFTSKFATGTIFERLPGVPVADKVTVTGDNIVGTTLVASYVYDDPMKNEESGSTGTWERADDYAFKTNVETIKTVNVSAATGSTYTLTDTDDNKYIRFTVTPRNAAAEMNVGEPVYFVFGQKIRKPQTKPVVALTAPSVGYKAYVDSEVTFSATATCDNTTITKVEFYANDNVIASSLEAPFTAKWIPTVDGDYNVYAKATNALGESTSTEQVAIKIYSLSESIEPVLASKWSYDFNDFTSTNTFTSYEGLPEKFPNFGNWASTITSAHGLFGKADDDYFMALNSADGSSETARVYMNLDNMDSGNNVYYAEMDVAFSSTDEARHFFTIRTSRLQHNIFSFNSNGNVSYNDSTGGHSFVDSNGNAVKYEANKWYHIGVVLDFKNTEVTFHLSYDDEDITVKTIPVDPTCFDYTSEISTRGIHSSGKQYGVVYMDNMACGQVQESYVNAVIETPTRGSYLSGKAISFKGYAKDSRGKNIQKVEIYGNGVLIGEASSGQFNISNTIQPGNYAIIAKAISEDGLVGYSNTVNITVSSVVLSDVFADNMVLQRNRDLRIAGTGSNGTIVTVKLLNETRSTTIENGKWEVMLPPQPTTKSTSLIVSADGVDTVFSNVAIGEVILCTGQSNMAYALNKFSGLISEADQAYDDIRLFKQGSTQTTSPQTNIPDGRWTKATQVESTSFSGIGYLLGKLYYLAENGEVPVGLVYAAHGGSSINVWVPNNGYLYDPDNKASRTTNTFYNKMIAPFTSTTIGHVFWYQGCANTYLSNNYEKLLTSYIDSYREEFNDDKMDFIIVQLPRFDFESSYKTKARTATGVRDGEWNVSQYVDDVATVVSIDCGEPGNIHPNDKLPIAQRAALALRHFVKPNDTSIIWQSPSYVSNTVADGKMTISFKNIAGGLKSADGQALRGFKVAGDDGVYADAVATIVSDTVVVDVSSVVGTPSVRYAWESVPTLGGAYTVVNLVGGTGLTVAPFRTDTGRYHFKVEADGTVTGVYNYTPMVRKITASDLAEGKVIITVNARDYDDTIATVEVFANGGSIGFATPIEGTTLYAIDWEGATVGTHTFYAIATDSAGATSISRDASLGTTTADPRQYTLTIADQSLVSLTGTFGTGITATAKDFAGQNLIIAAYNGNILIKTKISDQATVSLTSEELEGATIVKTFLFVDMSKIQPVTTPAVLKK
ncbi:MAG: leucine-rich repeat protein [Eubacteriales bacterium]|nr:leucine-rich repeat protein [Eubacteriales bacterium]